MAVTGYIYGLFDSGQPPHLWECRYVGLTRQTLARRLASHKHGKGAGRHQKNWVKSVHGAGRSIVMQVLETHVAEDTETLLGILRERERIWIAEGWRQGWSLTNQTEGGVGATGYQHSEESRAKIGDLARGRTASAETRAKMSAARIGKTHTEDTRAKLRELNTGENNPQFGKTQTPETIAKRSAAITGHIVTEETRQKISAKKKGYTPTPETLVRMSQAQTGKTHSPETKAKIAEGVRRARRKQDG